MKSPRPGRIHVSSLGLTDDEHDLTFHGGIDKAIHQYCVSHYPKWQELYPEPQVAERFAQGGFGENLIADGWSESSICVGDVVRIGPPAGLDSDSDDEDDAVLLEVSLPRQPCFKLNQRFGIKNFAGRTHALNRTGWYYRVLREGYISAGMELRIVERRHPRWTIERLHHFVHRETENQEAIEELVQIKELGNECKGVFENRLKKSQEAREEKTVEVWRSYKLVEKKAETPRIVRLTLEAVEGIDRDEYINHGSFVRLKLPIADDKQLIRSYSVVGGMANRFTLGIAREEESRGGSRYIHDVTKVDDIISVGKITQSIPLDSSASNHIIIAGGIGITAFLAAVERCEKVNFNYELHYAVRSSEDVAFKSLLQPLGEGRLKIYDKSKGERVNLMGIVKDRKWNSHVYVCGPQRMNDEVVKVAAECGMASDEVHFEAFQTDASGDPFTAEVVGREGKLEVGEDDTLLEVLKKSGFDIQSSCEVGNCGTCKINVCKGKVEHRGSALGADEKETSMLSCVSRGIGHIVVEIEV